MKRYRCLSVKQPFASMIASGQKKIETRKWRTSYRGDIVIVASLDQRDVLPISRRSEFPYGKAICVVKLIGIRPMSKGDEREACCELYDGAFAWMLTNVRRILPIKVKGDLGLYWRDLRLIPQAAERLLRP